MSMHKGSDKSQVKGGIQMAKRGDKNPQTEGWPLGGALYQKTHY